MSTLLRAVRTTTRNMSFKCKPAKVTVPVHRTRDIEQDQCPVDRKPTTIVEPESEETDVMYPVEESSSSADRLEDAICGQDRTERTGQK